VFKVRVRKCTQKKKKDGARKRSILDESIKTKREGGLESALSGRRGLESTLRKKEIRLESIISKG
jgi:hypothetical protein